jgi:23S rRNA pseudouridine2605 synthase
MSEKPIIKALTEAGIGSRRRMADAIKQGKVKVNGAAVESFNHPVDLSRDRVIFDGRPIDLKPDKTICLLLHKPAGVVSTVSDEKRRRTVISILPENWRKFRLYPVGRLDIDTTGLLLLTNDGDLTYRLTHPRYEFEKEYYVATGSLLKAVEKQQIRRGMLLEDGMTAPAQLKEIAVPPYNYSVIIHEGKKRQVRRMFERLRHSVLALKRVRIGNLHLGDLPEGEVRSLSTREITDLLGEHKPAPPKQPAKISQAKNLVI